MPPQEDELHVGYFPLLHFPCPARLDALHESGPRGPGYAPGSSVVRGSKEEKDRPPNYSTLFLVSQDKYGYTALAKARLGHLRGSIVKGKAKVKLQPRVLCHPF